MEEKNFKYIIQEDPSQKQTRNTWQRQNDMRALVRLSLLLKFDGQIEKSRKKPIIDFFAGKTRFKDSTYSRPMQANLMLLKRNWQKGKFSDNKVIQEIFNFVSDTTLTTVSETNTNSIFDTIDSYYGSDENHVYFSVEKLLADLVDGRLDDEQSQKAAIEEFYAFTDMMKEKALVSEDEDD